MVEKLNKEYIAIDEKYQKIIDVVNEQPGVQPSIITKKTGLNKDTVRYRLLHLQNAHIVRVIRAQNIIKIYPADYPIERDVSLKVLPVSMGYAGAGN